jgi:hypothetical protein
MNMAERQRQIVTFRDLDRDTRQKIADLLDHSSAAKLKFSSKSMMSEMSNHLNCVSLPSTYISTYIEPFANHAEFQIYGKSVIEWYRVIDGIHPSQRNPCIKIENTNEDYNGDDTVHIKYDPNQTYDVILYCNHVRDEQTMDDIERTIHQYYNFVDESHMIDPYVTRTYTHKTNPGITLTSHHHQTDGVFSSLLELSLVNHPASFKHVIETVVGAFTELQDSIDTLKEKKVEIEFRVNRQYLHPLNITEGEIGTVYMPLL